MNKHALLHIPESRFCFPLSKEEVVIRLRTAREDAEAGLKVKIIYGVKYDYQQERFTAEVPLKYEDELYAFYEVKLHISDVRLVYIFELEEKGKKYYFSEDGLTNDYNYDECFYNFFQLPYINENDVMPMVDWMPGTVFYQIFVDRFCIGDENKDMSYIDMKWGDKPTPKNHAGGDLKGIIKRLDYLKDLGISGIYLTPIFESESNHKYNIVDYKKIDPQFGTTEDLVKLVDEAHKRGIRIVLDAVFNHCSDKMAEFLDVVKNGRDSKFYDWFIIDGDKLDLKKRNYECFAHCEYMPKLNTAVPAVQEFLLDIATYWIDVADIDGWRLDVADEVSHDFWRQFRKAVKAKKSDAVIIGENWHDAYPALMGEQQDSIMNYAYTKVCLDYFAKERCDEKKTVFHLNSILMRNMEQVNYMMLNLLDSHDTLRFFTEIGKDKKKLETALALTMFFPGTPCMYYGTEIAMEGAYDPDCRRCFDWDKKHWDMELMDAIKGLLALKKNPVLQWGDVSIKEENGAIKVVRSYEGKSAVLTINSPTAYTIQMNA
ncbi:glycoside hydrolase family 13 protein [Butyrivibrio fibrisolvens]|uniref:glycoside hydrolase family 13 protein n=1 Tax=Pseudobutyrivibrio ruminis TaxID=46206 RepID=UPI0004117FB7|nr:glycoside hydrolase family 13 protein [Pseudobutyrivibrio ruminis]MDC7278542.1 glycoside hydrolase family 13 protein [Butyrivibrio fibrisolvens]